MLTELDPPYLLVKPCAGEEEFYALGEDCDWEYLDGRLVMSPASRRHEELFKFLLFLLEGFVDRRGGGLVLGSRYPMRLDERWSPEPDLMVVREERRHLMGPKYLDGPADLAIEIASDGDPRFEVREKLPRYREAQVPEIWMIDPFDEVVLVERRTAEGYSQARVSSGRLESEVVPGFWLEVGWLWEERLPSTFACLQRILA